MGKLVCFFLLWAVMLAWLLGWAASMGLLDAGFSIMLERYLGVLHYLSLLHHYDYASLLHHYASMLHACPQGK
jgi:hypothetical protein